jgi:tRNA(fMet)-specific endonuclease VapC
VDVTRYCLDTSAYSRFKLGEPAVSELIDSAFYVSLPSIAIGELLAGFRLGAHARRNTTELWDFLADPAADVLDVDVHVAERYSQIYGDLRESGTLIPTNDMWIAATASANGMAVLTFDSHFNAIPQVPSLVLEI